MSTHEPTSSRPQGVSLTPRERARAQEAFLQAFASTGVIRAACLAANVDRSTVRQWQEHDEAFAFRYQQANLDVDDLIDAELLRRGVHGEQEPMVSMGRVVRDEETGETLMVTKRSDQILMFIAKARMPKYRERQPLDPAALPVQGAFTIDPQALSDEELATLKQVLAQATQRAQERADGPAEDARS